MKENRTRTTGLDLDHLRFHRDPVRIRCATADSDGITTVFSGCTVDNPVTRSSLNLDQLIGHDGIGNLHADLTSGDVSKARRILAGVLGPINVRLLRKRKNPVWKLTFQSEPLTMLLGDLGSYKCGSGGPL